MKALSIAVILAFVISVAATPGLAQTTNDGISWRTLAHALQPGAAVNVRLRDGRRFKATFIAAHDGAIAVQRKTRVPVSIEEVPYDAIASVSRVESGSLSAAKVAGIALGSAGAAIVTVFLIMLATLD
jgi:hypothetical protein